MLRFSKIPICGLQNLKIGLVVLAIVALVGCGQNQKPVYPVQGKILCNGKPAQHAQVIFHPLAETDKDVPRPQGKVDADGTFTLTTYATGDGAPAGDYAVTVEWWLSPALSKKPGDEDKPPVNHLPAKYGKAATSGLTAQVVPGTNELPTIQLKK